MAIPDVDVRYAAFISNSLSSWRPNGYNFLTGLMFRVGCISAWTNYAPKHV